MVCFVTYGNKLNKLTEDGAEVYNKRSYVALSFFRVPGDFYTSENRPLLGHRNDGSYADEKAEDGGVIRRYFNAKYQYTKHFGVNNSHLYTAGDIVHCFV